MKGNWDRCFAMVIESEGGFVDHPKDPGGMTNLGVTRKNWEAYLSRGVSEAEMRALTPDVVKPFYKVMYWDKIKGNDLPAGVDFTVFDYAVNSGVSHAAKCLQRAIGSVPDGLIGPKSLQALNACDIEETIESICDMRLDFLKGLSAFETFGKGWTRRVEQVELKATSMARQEA